MSLFSDTDRKSKVLGRAVEGVRELEGKRASPPRYGGRKTRCDFSTVRAYIGRSVAVVSHHRRGVEGLVLSLTTLLPVR